MKLSKNDICAVIIGYYPDQYLFNRLELVQGQVGHIIVVDNSANSSVKEFLQTGKAERKITYIFNKQNLGTGTALNEGCHYAREAGYEWVLALDQDTIIDQFMVDKFVKIYADINNKERIAIIAPNFKDPHTKRVMFKQKKYEWIPVWAVITSGSLISLSAYNDIGPFRDNFFLDFVDVEYCLRICQREYRIILVTEPLMQHPIGRATTRSIFGIHRLNFTTCDHSPFRYYYITRNNIILIREYLYKKPKWAALFIVNYLKVLFITLCFGKVKYLKIKYIVLGSYDGIIMNMKRRVFNVGF